MSRGAIGAASVYSGGFKEVAGCWARDWLCGQIATGLLSRSSRLLGRWANGLDVPAPVLLYDGHFIGHLKASRGVIDRRTLDFRAGCGLTGELPHHADRYPARWPPGRDLHPGDGGERHRPAKSGHGSSWGEEPAECLLVTA